MSAPTRAVDASYDPLTRDEALCLQRNNWPLFVQCLWTAREQPDARTENLRVAFENGLDIAGYISLNYSRTGAWHVDKARSGVPDDLWEAMDFVAVDVELPGITLLEVIDAVDQVEALGKKAVIYTSYNAWRNYVHPGNPGDLARRGVPLWNALWDQNPDFDFPTLRYGGWSDDQVFMEQWSGGTGVCEQFVDRNTIVHPGLIYNQEEEEEVTPQELEAFNKRLKDIEEFQAGIAEYVAVVAGRQEAGQEFHDGIAVYVGEIAKRQKEFHEGIARHFGALVAKQAKSFEQINAALNAHVMIHNQSGSALDRESGPILNDLAPALVEMKNLAEAITTFFTSKDAD